MAAGTQMPKFTAVAMTSGCQAGWARSHFGLKVRGQEQVFQVRIGIKRFFDPIQKAGADDAAATPEQRDIAKLERPIVLFGRGRHLHEALRIAANLQA